MSMSFYVLIVSDLLTGMHTNTVNKIIFIIQVQG